MQQVLDIFDSDSDLVTDVRLGIVDLIFEEFLDLFRGSREGQGTSYQRIDHLSYQGEKLLNINARQYRPTRVQRTSSNGTRESDDPSAENSPARSRGLNSITLSSESSTFSPRCFFRVDMGLRET
jgi:hypothetical protein